MANRERALNTYRQSRVETASPAELVLTLFNVCLRNMKEAMNCIAEQDYTGANANLLRAQDITDELRGALDLSTGNLAVGLYALYDFVYSCLLKANISKEIEPIDDALTVMTQIRDAWEEAVRSYG